MDTNTNSSRGAFLVDGIPCAYWNAIFCCPGEPPHTVQVPGGFLYEENGSWVANLRGRPDFGVAVQWVPGATVAQLVARLFDDDGQCWETADGRSFGDVCADAGGLSRTCTELEGTRITFPDASALVEYEAFWDHAANPALDDCYCPEGAASDYPDGHCPCCPHSPE